MRRFWDSLRLPGGPLHRSASDVSRSFHSGVRSGNPGVFYDDQGRLYYHGDRQDDSLYPSTSLSRDKYQMRPEDTLTYDPRKSYSDSRSWQRSNNGTPRNSGRNQMITKHYDSYRRTPKLSSANYPGRYLPAGYTAVNGYGKDGRRYIREGSVLIEEHIVSHEKPWLWPLFLLCGLIILLVGILNALFCVDNYLYIHIWAPITIVIFAIVGAIHKGIYQGGRGRWRNILHIVAGCIATLFVFFALAFVMMRLNHVTLQIMEEGSSGFVSSETSKMQRYNLQPRVKLGQTYTDNIWACYSLDWIVIVLLIACFAILSSTIIIANNYYNSTQEYRREVEPFCRPQLFNPYGQISMGQAIAFVGILLQTTVHGNIRIEWQDYWVSVWVALLPMIAGAVTAIALKRVGLSKHKLLVTIGAILQFITLLITIAAIVIGTIALSDNIKALNPGPMAITSYSKSLLTASVFMFAINDIVLLVGLIYALALFIRLIAEGCRSEDEEPLHDKRYYSEDRYQSQLRPFTGDRYPSSFGRDKTYLPNGAEIREAVDARY